ncbi:MAG TPA: PIN domain-containing protein [Candidatus Angelobacter sp.]|jgi:predicted nucleic acid-binding protein|nr:PIN domain-containing protein [Candidatus Angelobacter sp.]
MPDKVFFDTNVLIYTVAQNDPRNTQAERLLMAGGVLSVQVLNEFVSVARRKILMSWHDVQEALDHFRILCPAPLPITIDVHQTALSIAQRYGYQIYDALIVATALLAGCATLYSEDLQNGQIIDQTLTVRNPFVRPSASQP